MVEIEEISDATEEKSSTPAGTDPSLAPHADKRRKTRKELPSVAYLLAHGDPETEGMPKTWADILWFPTFLCICFIVSLLTFHFAPHEKSVQPKGKFLMEYKMAEHRRQQEQLYHAQKAAMANVKAVPVESVTEEETKRGGTSGSSSEGEL